ncbi:MAG: hypothetical protein IJX93_08430 [Clostridia bacterium]|nr:hypothetical protein [Clostridia bacterium]MBQ8370160.1 hypothetical protein [Clostridia bacterium]
MKKLTVILLALAFVSCTKNDIAAGLETYRDIYTEAPEEGENILPYIPPEEEVTVTGILSSDFTIYDGKYYFELKHAFDKGGGVRMLAYADVETGNYGIVCQDHLCPHNSPDVCKYADLGFFCFTDKPGVFYAVRLQYPNHLCRVDLNNDTVERIRTADWGRKINSYSWNLLGYTDGRMYYSESVYYTENRMTQNERKIFCVDDKTLEISEIEMPGEDWPYQGKQPRFIWNGYFYIFTDNKIVRTDPTYTDTTVIADMGMTVSQWYLDTAAGELYFSCVERENNTGSVYVVKDGGAPEKLELPHEEIYTFTINQSRIYYTSYDPVYLGVSGQARLNPGKEDQYLTYDYTGGKLYAVDRDNPSGEPELVYEVSGIPLNRALKLEDAVVLGDYLYVDEVDITREVIDGTEYVYFDYSRDVSKLRIGLKDGSAVRIVFE